MNGTKEAGDGKDVPMEEIAMMPKAGWGSKGEKDEAEVEQSCGVGRFRPKVLKKFSGIWTFSIIFGLSTLLTSSSRTYLSTQVMMLERQLEVSSTTTGALLSCTDIGFLVFVLFASYMARRWNIPRVLAVSTAMFGIASLLCVLPHGITKNDLYPPPVVTPNTTYSMEKLQLKAPSCMISNLPPDLITSMMKRMGGGLMPGPVLPSPGGLSGGGAASSTTSQPRTTMPTNPPLPEAATSQPPPSGAGAPTVATAQTAQPLPTTTPAPTPPGEVLMMLNFTKLSKHPQYEMFAQMALPLKIDLKSVAAMSKEDQIKYVHNLPPDVRAMLPTLKAMLGEDADSYFYPITVPKSRRRRDVSTDMMHTGMLSQLLKRLPPLPDSVIHELAVKMCPFNTSAFMKSSSSVSVILALIGIGMLLQGIARAPRMAFMTIFVDDSVEESQVGVFLGIIMGLGTLGSAFAMGIGGASVMKYVTLEDTGLMTIFNPRWLGAWWLGFLIYGILTLLLAVPIMLFPRVLPSAVRSYREEPKKAKTKLSRVAKESKGFVMSMMRLVGNPVYVLLTLGNAVSVLAVVGVISFLPKYVETQFSKPPYETGFILSIIYFLAATLGMIVGGIIMTKAKLTPLKCVKMVVIIVCILFIVQACAMAFGCDQPKVDKGDKIVGNKSTELCNNTCVCVKEMYAPVCGSDGISYYSPCHAGCGDTHDGKYHHCKCIDDHIKTAKPMLCEQPCNFFYAFCAVLVLAGFLIHLKAVPAFIATYRCVEPRDAPLAIGTNVFISTLVGFIPSPIIFGAVIDATCSLHRPPCGFIGPCAFYDIVTFRLKFHGLSTALRAVSAIIYIVALVIGMRKTSVFSRKIYHKDRMI